MNASRHRGSGTGRLESSGSGRHRHGGWIAGGASGALAALALPPFYLWPCVFFALVPLVLFLSDVDRRREEVVEAGLAFGLLYYGLLLHWGPFTAHGMVPFGAVAGILLPLMLIGLAGLQALVLHHLLGRLGASPVLAVPAVWTVTELVLARAGSLAMPWTPLALALAVVPELAGIAEWTGIAGVSLWIAAVNGGVAAAVGRGPRAAAIPLAGATLLLVLLPATWGVVRAQRLPILALPPILLVQMDLTRAELLDRSVRDWAAAAALERIVAGFGPDGLGPEALEGGAPPVLAILPEAPFGSAWGPELEARMRSHARSLGMPVLTGAMAMDGSMRRNTMVLVTAEGPARTVHQKERLVPGVEWPGLARGPGGDMFEVAGVRLGVLICFESAFGSEGRRLRRTGAELLVNPTNDGWFRPRLGAGGTAGHAQHRAHLVLRAVESRMGAVRAPIGGELLVIHPTGRVLLSRPPGGEGILPVQPVGSPVVTGFVRYGELGSIAGLLLLGGLLASGLGGAGRPEASVPRDLPGQ